MTPPISRRRFVRTPVVSASGPLIARAGALPGQRVTMGIMGLNRAQIENGHVLDDSGVLAFRQREYENGWMPVV